MSMPEPLRANILVAGDSLAAWMGALAFSRWRPELAVAVAPYHGEDSPIADPVVIARPEFRKLMAQLGLTEADLVSECDGTFLLATRHAGWTGEAAVFHQALGTFGAPANGAAFHHYYQQMRAAGQAPSYGTFSLATSMALAGKFIHPAANPRALESAFDYRIAIDAAKLRDLAKHRALAAGVTQFSTKVMGTAWSDGRIRHLLLDGEQSAEVDFYLDCTGTARGLTGAAGWTGIQALPYRRETGSVETGDGNLSLATVTASPDRWTRELALRTRRVTETFSCLEDGLAHFGYLAVPWRGNCVALGRAACDLPALHAPAFSLLTRELGLLGALLPADPATARVEAREYNRRALTAFGHMRDAQALFEAASARTQGKPSPDLSDNLARKIEQFTSRGRLVMYDDEILSDSEWIACLLGLGFTPECVSPLAMAASVDAVCDNYLRFAKRIRQAVERMPDQQTYIQHMLAEYAKETGPDAV